MTRKQALHKALDVLTDSEAIIKINEIIEELPLVCVNFLNSGVKRTLNRYYRYWRH
jgi:hypothetical protein